MLNLKFWRRKRVLITGHTGFKGGWLAAWLARLGAQATGLALEPDTEPSFYRLCRMSERVCSLIADVRDGAAVREVMQRAEPEVVFHLAAQAIVRRSYRHPVETFATNVMGTVHVLEAARHTPSVRSVVIITSDKCYAVRDGPWGYRETERLGGDDPYSASKACAEIVTAAYRRSFLNDSGRNVPTASARAGNVIGGGDWAEDRLVPDVIRALQKGQPVRLRHPTAIRPWQHVMDALAGYLLLAERLFEGESLWRDAWNFGPAPEDWIPVSALTEMLIRAWGSGNWQAEGKASDDREAPSLRLDATKAQHVLGWHRRLALQEALGLTVEWYQAAALDPQKDLYELTCEQIAHYENRLNCAPGQ
jgi:CDP-glucose 4,6-dehydratase